MEQLGTGTTYQNRRFRNGRRLRCQGRCSRRFKRRHEGNFVTIEYELKKEENREENGKTVRNERYYGMQSRSFALAQEVDESRAEAMYRDGVLELKLPKKPGSTKTRLAVN